MAKGFPDSVVLTQNSDGHCTLSAPSLCVAKYIRRYFQDGILPAPGTVCEVDYLPFIGSVAPDDEMSALSEDDKVLLEAMKEAPVITDFLKGV